MSTPSYPSLTRSWNRTDNIDALIPVGISHIRLSVSRPPTSYGRLHILDLRRISASTATAQRRPRRQEGNECSLKTASVPNWLSIVREIYRNVTTAV